MHLSGFWVLAQQHVMHHRLIFFSYNQWDIV